MALPSEVVVERDWGAEEERVLLVVVWAEGNNSVEVGGVSVAVRANYLPAEPVAETVGDSGEPSGDGLNEQEQQEPTRTKGQEGTAPSPIPSGDIPNSAPTEG
jgi:hypothetical protein